MRKPCNMSFNRFVEQLTGMNNFLPLSPVSDLTKKIPSEELNEILIHAVPNRWSKQSYIQGWVF